MDTWDYIVVGSGFGGSVAALRLVEKGYRVLVLEAGRRFADGDFARSNWNLRRFLYLPRLGLRGIMRLDLFRGLTVLSGAGVGGGSLVYANTLIEPSQAAFAGAGWPRDVGVESWSDELKVHYATAKRMLGATPAPATFPADQAIKRAAEALGFGESFHPVDVGVYFGKPGETVKDPYFGGAGPDRSGCVLCGGCMVGCRHNAKNTLTKNYLYLAERGGAVIRADAEVSGLAARTGGGYDLTVRRPGIIRGPRQRLTAANVVLAAGVLGTMRLLLDCRDGAKTLPNLSPSLGTEIRTNSESIIGVRVPDKHSNLWRGIAIAAGVNPNGHTKIEAVRYPKGSDVMGFLGMPLVESRGVLGRVIETIGAWIRHPSMLLQRLWPLGFASQTIILLVMQSLDSKLRLRWRRGRIRPDYGASGRPPVLLPEGIAFAKKLAELTGGVPGGSILDLMNMSLTAHILGGCPMGRNADQGVIDQEHQVFNYPGLYVVGGAAVPANLGVNPSLTITAMAERAMERIPVKGSVRSAA